MSEPLVIIDSSEIAEGSLDELKAAFSELAGFVEANESRIIAYDVYLDESASTVTVLQVHPDAASAELHMEVAGPAFGRFSTLLQLSGIDVYGAPSRALLDRLHKKAELLGGAPVRVHALHAGFTRIGSPVEVRA